MSSVEKMVEDLKRKVAQALEQPDLSLKDMYQLAKIIEVLADLERELGGSEKEIKEFIEKLMRRVNMLEKKPRSPR
ncbi:hypothetical protein J7L13_00820 [bacterium]|nr:hypothetical protein [bacterium]